jgi:hypothetical protein
MLAISLFGGQITFTVILSDIFDPTSLVSSYRSSFSKETVRIFVSLSWMFFTIALGLSAIGIILLSDSAIQKVAARSGRGMSAILLVLDLLPMGAFLFLALAVTAYVPVVGWIVLAFGALGLVVAFVLWWVMDVREIRRRVDLLSHPQIKLSNGTEILGG